MIIIEDFYKNRPPRLYEDYAPSLRSERNGLKVIEEVDKLEKLTTRGSDIASTIRATIYKQGSRNLIENFKSGKGYEGVLEMDKTIRIRKLTPTECYKLMGFTVEDCKRASESGISNAQLYKQAGNSIVVNVLEAIFKSLGETYEEFGSSNYETS